MHAVCAEQRPILLVDVVPLELFNTTDSYGYASFHLAVANNDIVILICSYFYVYRK